MTSQMYDEEHTKIDPQQCFIIISITTKNYAAKNFTEVGLTSTLIAYTYYVVFITNPAERPLLPW